MAAAFAPGNHASLQPEEGGMNIFYIIGVIVVVLAILSFLGLR
jgi:hypothetical protein